jgi:hypothetical protein
MTKEESTPSFARDILPLFRPADRVAMRWAFDLGNYQDVSAHAQAILGRLASGTMPCDRKWPEERAAGAGLPEKLVMLAQALSDPVAVLSLRGMHGQRAARRTGADEGSLLAYRCSPFS